MDTAPFDACFCRRKNCLRVRSMFASKNLRIFVPYDVCGINEYLQNADLSFHPSARLVTMKDNPFSMGIHGFHQIVFEIGEDN